MDFKSMSRKELQALCKEHRLPANTTNSIMAESLASLLQGSDKIKRKGCLKGSGGSSGDDGGGGRRPAKKVTFTLQEEVLRFGESKAIRSPEKRRSSRRRSVIGSELIDLSNGAEEMRSTRSRSATGSVSSSAVAEVERDRVSVGDSHLGRTQVRRRGNSKDEGEKLEKNEKTRRGETRKRSRGVDYSGEMCGHVGNSNLRGEEPPLRRSRRNLLKSENSLVANGSIRSGEGIESTDKLGQNASEISNGEDKNYSSVHQEDESLAVGRRKLQRKQKKTDTEAERDTETWPSKHEAPMRRSTRKVIVSNVLEKGNTSLAGGKRESKRSGARCASKRIATTSSEDEIPLSDVETEEETKTVVETNEGPRRSRRNASKHTVTGVEITLPVTEKGINGGIINGRKNLKKRHPSEVDVSTVVTENLIAKTANKVNTLQKQQSDEVVEEPFVEARVASCETFGEAEALEGHRLNEEPKRRSRRNISKYKLCAPADEITEKKREVKRTKAALLVQAIPVLESEADEVVDKATPQDDLSLNQDNDNSCQESIRNAVTNDASDHKLLEETPKMLDMNDEEGLVIVISGKKQSSQNPNKEAENCKYGDTVFLEESNTAEKLDGSINKQDNSEEMEYDDGEISIPRCLDTSYEIIETTVDDNVCLNPESVLDHDGVTEVDSETLSHVDMKDSASSADRKKLEEQINNQSAVQFVDAESGGSIFIVGGSCNSEVAINSQCTVIGHSEGFSSQTAPETCPLVDWKTTATSLSHDAVEAANGCSPTDTANDQDECLQPSNVAIISELGDYSEKLKRVRPQTGPCNVTPKTILSVERTRKICNRMKDSGQTQIIGEVGGSNARAAKDDVSTYNGDDMFVTSKTKVDSINLEEAEVRMNEDHTKLVGNEIACKPHIQDDDDGKYVNIDEISLDSRSPEFVNKDNWVAPGAQLQALETIYKMETEVSLVMAKCSPTASQENCDEIESSEFQGAINHDKRNDRNVVSMLEEKMKPVPFSSEMNVQNEFEEKKAMVKITNEIVGKTDCHESDKLPEVSDLLEISTSKVDELECRAADDLFSVKNRVTASSNKRKRQEVGADLGYTTSVDLRTSDNMPECDLTSIALEANGGVSIEKSKEAVHKTAPSSANTEMTTADEVTVTLELSSKKFLPENGEALGFLNERPNLSSMGAEFAGERDASVEERSIVNSMEAELLPENIEASEQSSFEISLIETKSFSGFIQQSCSLASCELTEHSAGISADNLRAKFEAAETQKKLDKTIEKLFLVLSTLKDGNIEETSGTEQARNTPNDIMQTFEQDFVDYEENAESCSISKNVTEQNGTGTISEEQYENDIVDNHVTPGALLHTEEGKQSPLSGSTNLMSLSSSHFQVIDKPESPGNNNGGTAVEYSSTARHSLIGFKDFSAEIPENSLVDHGFALESINWESGKKDYHVNSGCEKSIASQPTADLRHTDEPDVGNNEVSEDRMKLVEKNAGCKNHDQCSDNDGKHGEIDEVSFDSMSQEFISETNWVAPGAHLPSLEALFCVEREVPAIMTDCSQTTTQEHSVDNDSCEFTGETANKSERSHKTVAPMESEKMTTVPFLLDTTVENEVEVQKNLADLASDCLEMIYVADDPPARIGLDLSANGDKSQEEGTNLGYGNSVDLKTSDEMEVSVTKKLCTEVVEPFDAVSCYKENTNQDFVEKPEEAIDKPTPQSAKTEMIITEEITVGKELDSEEQLQPQSSDIVDQSVGTVGDQCILNNSEAENVEATESSHGTSFVENRSISNLIQQDCGSDSRQVMEVSNSISVDNHASNLEETDSSQCQDRVEEICHQLPSVSILNAKKFGNTSCNSAITADKNKENTPAIKINHSNKRNVDKSTTKSLLRRPLQIIHSSKAELL
ncbi:uncharacterized protein LOC109726221 isoform X3 [Ananas comosus]|uniref:Uncharacterized protein LOC109726221 isoform X3 n=1 Tax=Ananas comosus TaxID=4615 RepID=A0A6P5H067_ANACO|nr:uncharacterized protein LOC109726221 isoform X3 [Ananas comosus]